MTLPSPPLDYDQKYMIRLVRRMEAVVRHMENRDVTIASLRVTDLPTSATGLSSGQFWNDSGTVKVVV